MKDDVIEALLELGHADAEILFSKARDQAKYKPFHYTQAMKDHREISESLASLIRDYGITLPLRSFQFIWFKDRKAYQ
jgi:hypothetical protein